MNRKTLIFMSLLIGAFVGTSLAMTPMSPSGDGGSSTRSGGTTLSPSGGQIPSCSNGRLITGFFQGGIPIENEDRVITWTVTNGLITPSCASYVQSVNPANHTFQLKVGLPGGFTYMERNQMPVSNTHNTSATDLGMYIMK